jgi:hypothetical protein
VTSRLKFYFLDNRLRDDGDVENLHTQEDSWQSFMLEVELSQGP